MPDSRAIELSKIIARDTAIVEDFCTRHNIPSPSYDSDAPPTVIVPPSELAVSLAQDNVIAVTRELSYLMRGPQRLPKDIGFYDAFAFQAVSRFQIAKYVPLDGPASFVALAEQSGMKLSDLRRVLRFATTNVYFCESSPRHIAHTSFSRGLAEKEIVRGDLAFTFEECFPASTKATDALYQHPGSEEPTLSGWGLANNTREPSFAELNHNYPLRLKDSSIAIDAWNSRIQASPLVYNFPWDTVDTVVDIGGGHRHVSLSIAKQHARPTFVVQYMASVVGNGPAHIAEEFQPHIRFMEHDVFREQPVKDTDISHDWPDKYCVKMLQALVPALKAGARIVINDASMPPWGASTLTSNRTVRMWDLNMMLLFNARDRETADWAQLFHQADKRLRFLGARTPSVNVEGIPQAFLLSIIETVWQP